MSAAPYKYHLNQSLWICGNLHTLLGLLALFLLTLPGEEIIWLFTAIVATATFLPRLSAAIPRSLFNWIVPLLVCGMVIDFVLSGADFLPPLVRMIALLAVYRSLQMRTPREDLQLLMLSLFMLLIGGALSLEMAFVLWILPYTMLALGCLFMVHLVSAGMRRESETTAGPVIWKNFSWFNWLRCCRKNLDRGFVLLAGGLFLLTNLGAALLFLSLPRFDFGQALPFLKLPSSRSLSGFTDQVSFGDVIDIMQNPAVAFRVDTEGVPPEGRLYWKMAVLDQYRDGVFRRSERMRESARERSTSRLDGFLTNIADADQNWIVYYESGISRYLPVPGPFRQLHFSNRQDISWHPLEESYATREVQSNVLFYRFEKMNTALAGLRPAWRPDDDVVDLLLHLDLSEADKRVLREWLERVPLSERGEDHVRSLAAALQNGRGYQLETRIPGGGGDRLVRWLASSEGGHCELYAGAFVLLARASGYPARMVTGFLGGDWNGFENYLMVRQSHAHAWAEVLLPEGRWLRVDPTPGNGLSSDADMALGSNRFGGLQDRSWQAWMDSLRIQWYRRIVNFDREQQLNMVAGLRNSWSAGWKDIRDWLRSLFNKPEANEEPEGGDELAPPDKPGVSAIVLLTAMVLIVFSAAYFLLRRLISLRMDKESRIRRKAGKLLSGLKEESCDGELWAELQLIRYGDSRWWPDTGKVFSKVKR